MASNSDNLIGKTLGTCTLEKLIGQGGMGEVYLARQARPSRYVAVKVLLPNTMMNSEVYRAFLARFQREADVIAKLEHINIMPIYEYGEEDGLAYLVMPYLPGGSLREMLAQRGAFSQQQTAIYIDQAAAALDYAHGHGVIHRDIKPSNFLLHSDGRLILADFGIARIMRENNSTSGSTLTSTGMFLGTSEYMAPEMLRGEQIDHRADIYELGVVLFQMLSGQVPFKGDTPIVVATKHLQEPLPLLHQRNLTIPVTVDTVVQKATAKNRENRYPSAGALAQALHVAISSPDYPSESETELRNAPTLLSSRSSIPPVIAPSYQTPSPVQHPLTPIIVSASDWSRGAVPHGGLATPGVPLYPPPPPPQPKRTQPWWLLIAAFFVIVIAFGGVFLALQSKGTPRTNLPATTPTTVNVPSNPTIPASNPTTAITAAPTLVPPTPVPPTSVPPTPVPPTPTPIPTPSSSQQAQAVVQTYFDDINNKDYPGAYNQLGAAFQRSQSYQQFSSGFANTIHDSITFGNITPLSDGTVQVGITVVALERSSSGTTTSTFQGYYIVGQENGAWKLLRANLN